MSTAKKPRAPKQFRAPKTSVQKTPMELKNGRGKKRGAGPTPKTSRYLPGQSSSLLSSSRARSRVAKVLLDHPRPRLPVARQPVPQAGLNRHRPLLLLRARAASQKPAPGRRIPSSRSAGSARTPAFGSWPSPPRPPQPHPHPRRRRPAPAQPTRVLSGFPQAAEHARPLVFPRKKSPVLELHHPALLPPPPPEPHRCLPVAGTTATGRGVQNSRQRARAESIAPGSQTPGSRSLPR